MHFIEVSMLLKKLIVFSISMLLAPIVFGKTIALVQINQQAQFFTDMNRGAEDEAATLGHKLVIFNANNDPAAQNNAIETYIQQRVDGLIVVAIDTNGIMPAVIQAANAGIPVVAVDAILPDGPHIAQVGVNNYGAGVMIANAFLDYVTKEMGGTANIGIVGALNSTIQNVRQKGFTDTLSKNSNVNIAGVVDGRNVSEQAMAASENLFTANPR
jgi:ribose transport system substrate-binding protein